MKLVRKILLLTTVLLPLLGFSQEVLTGITHNAHIAKESKKIQKGLKSPNAVKLPFFDDFSNYTGYPSSKKWADNQAFVNTGFAIYPPSIGVVTLDAIDKNGKVYSHANTTGFSADTLTSALIRLDSNFVHNRPMQVSDSIYMSFYYQPAGGSKSLPINNWERIGDAPDHQDKLVLEFGYSTGNIVFSGFVYGEYIIENDTYYHVGDSVENPFIPGTYYVFENDAFAGQTIMMPADSLFSEEYVWHEVWSVNGCKLDEWLAENPFQYFKQVMIPITDPQYFRKNFQFRFRNYASIDLDSWTGGSISGWASNCDQWNLDYIEINTNRTINDIFPSDVAFVSPSTSALKDYTAMPWRQFTPSDLASNFHNELSNLSNSLKNTYYNYSIIKNNYEHIYTSVVNNENARPFYTNGLHTYEFHAEPVINMPATYDGADSALFTITHVFGMVGTNDECRSNDTCITEQKFYNYYAYDDGVAEAGYSLLSTMTNPHASFAVKFSLNYPDTLQAVRFWFNRALNDENVAPFILTVWDDNYGEPGNIIYELPSQLPSFADDYLNFVTYYLEEPMPVSGTFYVGFQQNHDTQLNIGFDQNNDARGKFFYKTTSAWKESFLKGAPMVRAVVGKSFDHSGIPQHNNENAVSLYPNPTYDLIFIQTDLTNLEYQLYDSYGRLLESNNLYDNTLSMIKYPSGLYFLKLFSDNKHFCTKKIIKH